MSKAPALFVALSLAAPLVANAQSEPLSVPRSVTAGSAFSIPTTGTGKGLLYIVGPGQALKRDVQMGESVAFGAGDLYSAGHYLVLLVGASSTGTGEFDVVPAAQPATLSFLAKPSRLPVGQHNGISGAVYVFDAYRNLITTPLPTTLELSNTSGILRSVNVTTRNGMAWTEMDSAAKQGAARFVARVSGISSTRVIVQVPGDPCGLTISARPEGGRVEVQTAPVRDCSGNPVPDGTIVTFSETYNNTQSTVDVPIKQGIASVHMPAHPGAKISVASGVVAGNEIRLGGGQ